VSNISVSRSAANENTPAYAIEVAGISAGLALRERGGFCFFAVDPRFQVLEQTKFRRLGQVENAVRLLAKFEGSRRAGAPSA
jgi:hypothetical protein